MKRGFDNFNAVDGFLNISGNNSEVSSYIGNTSLINTQQTDENINTWTFDVCWQYIYDVFNVFNNIGIPVPMSSQPDIRIKNTEPEYALKFNYKSNFTSWSLPTTRLRTKMLRTIWQNYRFANGSAESFINNFKEWSWKWFPDLGQEEKRRLLIDSLPNQYKDVFIEPFYSQNLSEQEKVNMTGELRAIANRTDLSLIDKQNTAKDIIDIYVPTLPSGSSSTTSSMGSMGSASTDEQRTEGATTDFKANITKYAIIGGVLVVGGIATWLILKRN